MEGQLKLEKAHHDLFWKRKAAIEAMFKVQILPFLSFSDNRGTKNGGNNCNRGEYYMHNLVGADTDVAALKKYVNEVFVRPEIIEIVSYHRDLETIFRNALWINIFEEIYNVCIIVRPDCELNIYGPESSALSTAAAFEELIAKYHACKDTLFVNSEKSLAQKLAMALKACKNVDVSAKTFESVPNDVIKLLLSFLEKAYNESFPVLDDPESLDDSVLIIDPPEKGTKEVCLVILDSDSDCDSNSKRQLESCSSEKVSKKKLKREKKLKKKRSRALENVVSLSALPNCLELQNGHLQSLGVENSLDKSKLPKIENPNFIPLSLGSAYDNSPASEIPPQQCDQPSGEVQMKNEEVEIVAEDIPKEPRQLRPIIIDGCNVAFYSSQGRREDFSWKRIEICLNFFLSRGHDVKVFLPQYRRPLCYEKSGNQDHVENLESKQQIIFTPSRKIDGRTVSCYDDRFVVDLASRNGGIILSNDNYRDLINENPDFAKTIKERLLMYVFAGDELMIPEDPLGKSGPRLDEFLSFPVEK